jgi:hypothetical protein
MIFGATHSAFSLQISCPVSSLYFPVGQSLHPDRPIASPYLPVSHGAQEAVPVANVVIGQVVDENAHVSWPRRLYEPLAHGVHALVFVPVEFAYVPAAHFLQDDLPRSSWYKPLAQLSQACEYTVEDFLCLFPDTCQPPSSDMSRYLPNAHGQHPRKSS